MSNQLGNPFDRVAEFTVISVVISERLYLTVTCVVHTALSTTLLYPWATALVCLRKIGFVVLPQMDFQGAFLHPVCLRPILISAWFRHYFHESKYKVCIVTPSWQLMARYDIIYHRTQWLYQAFAVDRKVLINTELLTPLIFGFLPVPNPLILLWKSSR